MIRLAGCEDGGCPGLWMDGDRLLAQGTQVTDPRALAMTKPSAGETVVALPRQMLGEALATAMTRLLA